MKISFKLILAALVATAALAGCAKELTPGKAGSDPTAPTAEGSRVIAVSFGSQTRTTLDGSRPKFEEGDKILVANGQDEPDTCVVTLSGETATITTKLTGPLTAVYPAKAAKMDGGNPKKIDGILVSTEQDGSFANANIAMAKDIGTSATFTNQTAVFKIVTNAEAEYVEVSTEEVAIANSASGKYTALNKIHVEAEAGDTVYFSILPAGLNVCDLSFSDGTITKTFNGNDTPIEINTICTGPLTSDNFYITGGPFGWNMNRTDERKFSHSGKSILEDPWFTITFPAALSGGTWFAFFDDAAYNNGEEDWYCLFGTSNGDGNSGESGYAARRKNLKDDGVFAYDQGCDSIKVEFNALTFEYKVTEIFSGTPHFPEYIYEIGNESGWQTSHPLASPARDGIYRGYYYLDGEYKFKPYADNWNWDWEYNGDKGDGVFILADTGGDNFPLPSGGAGVYQINVDLNLMVANLVKVENISLIGGFGGWGTDVDLTYNAEGGYWECNPFVLEEDGELKFRMNHDWAFNWGGSFDSPAQDGDNLNIKAGTYHVKFYLSCDGNNRIVFDPATPGPDPADVPVVEPMEGALDGVFTVSDNGTPNDASDDIRIRFSQGNLYADASDSDNLKFYFEGHQYDTVAVKGDRSHLGHFYWSKDPAVSCSTTYEDVNSSSTDVFFTNDPANPQSPKEGFTVGGLSGFRTLTADEWKYLLKSRANADSKVGYATVGGVHGIIILPDVFIDPKKNTGGNGNFVSLPATGWDSNIYTVGESGTWNEMESARAVFLPVVGYREGSEISGKKSMGFYWSASYFDSMVGQPFANYLFICDDTVDPADRDFCKYGYSVRLVAAVSIE